MGLATALELSLAGCEVDVFESSTVANEMGGSGGIGRIFRITYPDAEVIPVLLEADRLWDELESVLGARLRTRTGSLDYGDDEQVGAFAAALDASGVQYRYLTKAEVSERWPALELSGRVLFQPDGALIHSEVVLRELAAGLVRRGVTVNEQMPVAEIAPHEDRVAISVDGEERLFDRVAVCAGAASAPLCNRFFDLPDVNVTQEYTLTFDDPGGHPGYPVACDYRNPPIFGESYFWLPCETGRLKLGVFFSGATLQAGDARSQECPRPLADELVRYASESFVGGDGLRGIEFAPCTYDISPDEWFSFGASDSGKVVAANGFSGHGFKFAPYVGRTTAAALLADGAQRPTGLPWSPQP